MDVQLNSKLGKLLLEFAEKNNIKIPSVVSISKLSIRAGGHMPSATGAYTYEIFYKNPEPNLNPHASKWDKFWNPRTIYRETLSIYCSSGSLLEFLIENKL